MGGYADPENKIPFVSRTVRLHSGICKADRNMKAPGIVRKVDPEHKESVDYPCKQEYTV